MSAHASVCLCLFGCCNSLMKKATTITVDGVFSSFEAAQIRLLVFIQSWPLCIQNTAKFRCRILLYDESHYLTLHYSFLSTAKLFWFDELSFRKHTSRWFRRCAFLFFILEDWFSWLVEGIWCALLMFYLTCINCSPNTRHRVELFVRCECLCYAIL